VTGFHLAQMNLARMRARFEDPLMEGFRSQLEAINAVADSSPGFVWRLQTPDGDATSLRVTEDDRILINMSVWASLEALHQYVYKSPHVQPLRDRKEWFEPLPPPSLVLWWISAGHIPSIEEAMGRLQELVRLGPTQAAFTFRQPFPPPGQGSLVPPEVDAEFCRGAC
jgi:hypothetical protein